MRGSISRIDDLLKFRDSNFTDARYCIIVYIHKRAYFVGLIFAVCESTVKTAKIGPLKNFPLYGVYCIMYALTEDVSFISSEYCTLAPAKLIIPRSTYTCTKNDMLNEVIIIIIMVTTYRVFVTIVDEYIRSPYNLHETSM